MPRRTVFDIDVGVGSDVFYRDFTTIDYWQDLVAHYRSNSFRTEIAHFGSDETGTDVVFTHIMSAEDLPAIARAGVPATFIVRREQHFDPFDHVGRRAAGHFRAEVPVPVDISGHYVLADTDGGSRMRLEARCTVRVPVIGGQIEQLVLTGLRGLFAREGEFTADWVAGHH